MDELSIHRAIFLVLLIKISKVKCSFNLRNSNVQSILEPRTFDFWRNTWISFIRYV